MRIRPRVLLPLTLLCLVACAGSDNTLDNDEGERDQALLDARDAADSAATTADGNASTPPPPLSCDATAVQGLVGEASSDELVEQARTDAGADSVRVLKPGQAVTLEFNGARLNVEVDEDGRVVSLRCG